MEHYPSKLDVRSNPAPTFFLWGPRQSGTCTLLSEQFPKTPEPTDSFVPYESQIVLSITVDNNAVGEKIVDHSRQKRGPIPLTRPRICR